MKLHLFNNFFKIYNIIRIFFQNEYDMEVKEKLM